MKENCFIVTVVLLLFAGLLLLELTKTEEPLAAEQLRYLRNLAASGALTSEQVEILPKEALYPVAEGYVSNVQGADVQLRILAQELEDLATRVFGADGVPEDIRSRIDEIQQRIQLLRTDSAWSISPRRLDEANSKNSELIEAMHDDVRTLHELTVSIKDVIQDIHKLSAEIRKKIPPRH